MKWLALDLNLVRFINAVFYGREEFLRFTG
jgi:hypothetical protein